MIRFTHSRTRAETRFSATNKRHVRHVAFEPLGRRFSSSTAARDVLNAPMP